MDCESPVQLQQLALNLVFSAASWQGFDRFEVWRSHLAAEGAYTALHGDSWAPASLPLGFTGQPDDVGAKAPVGGLTLEFLVMNQFPVTVTIPGTGWVTLASVAAAIAAQAGNLLYSYPSGSAFVVQTRRVGAVAALQCTGGDAAPLLGLAVTGFRSVAYGQDARIPLVQGQSQYGFVDPYGNPDFFYETRFFSSTTRSVSAFSLPFQGPTAPAFSSDNLVTCYVRLADGSGAPLANQEVLLSVSDTQGLQVSGSTVIGNTSKLLTDSTGYAQVLLVRNTKVTVAIGGTALARDVCIPTDPSITSLDLLSPSVGRDDLFSVQAPVLDFAVRRTL